MNATTRTTIIVVGACILAIFVGQEIADHQYILALLLTAAAFCFGLEWTGSVSPEALLITCLMVGYVLGNRGFAQLAVVPGSPLFFGEIGLAAGLSLLFVRSGFRRTLPIRRDLLNLSVGIWFLVGSARIFYDFRTYGFDALRDFATIYYAGYFFLGQAVAKDRGAIRLLRPSLIAAFSILPFTFLITDHYREWVFSLRIAGAPLLYYKDDLVAAFLFVGFFLIPHWPAPGPRGGLWRWLFASVAYAVAFNINSSRAAIVGLGAASSWWWLARRWKPLEAQAVLAAVGIFGLFGAAAFSREDFDQSRLYALYEHFASIVDVSGTRQYRYENRAYVGDNNRFRLAWWKAVASETVERNPVYGLGFGHNLADRFVKNYETDLGDEFTTRSPHSIVFTMFGRMGLLGVSALGLLFAALFRATLRVARRAREHEEAVGLLALWSGCWIILVSACFGVVLEGPMGAVLFWTLLGIANTLTGEQIDQRFLAQTSQVMDIPSAPPFPPENPQPAAR